MSIYEIIINKVLEALYNNQAPWISPYSSVHQHQNFISKIPYKGINTMLLNAYSYNFGFEYPFWVSFKQLTQKGWHLKKGSKSAIVTFYKKIAVAENADPEADETREHIVLRYYNVFNIQQLEEYEEIKATFSDGSNNIVPTTSGILFDYIRNSGVGLLNQQSVSCSSYSPALDRITMASCNSMEEYVQTLAHEIIHSTGHSSRLNRTFGNRMSEQGRGIYSMEELIAEMGSVMLCNEIGESFRLNNSATYCSSWAQFLRQEKKTAVVKAASMAQKAVEYVLNVATAENTVSANV